jgi:glycosyltransferase involved in cell wall biosynthesis
MQNKGTLWIDVTMLVNWHGHLTGIQRVEYNLAKRYSELPNVKFCVFHKEQQKITEFDFKHIAYKVEMLQQQTAAPAAIPAMAQRPLYRRALSKMKRLAGSALSPETKAFLRGQIHRRTINEDTPITFKQNDTFLILSGDWSDETFANLIIRQRQQTHVKVVQIVYDMLPAVFPGYFVPGMADQFTTYMAHIFANCDGILAISESTKHDVEQFMQRNNIAPVDIAVFRLGDNFVKQTPAKPAIGVTKNNYILCVCTIEGRKNHMLLYYAAREAMLRGEDFPTVVLVGKKGWLANDFIYMVENDPVLSKKVIFTRPSDQELAWLYQNCLFTVFPSFYEGWGLMVAESLFYGKLCLSSGVSSMPEIGGKLVDYFSPNDPVQLLEKIQHYLKHPHDIAKKEEAVKKHYKAVTWDETFAQVRDFVANVQ